MKTVLTVAGSDPTGGAGLQADLKVFRSFGVHGLSVPSALTVQNTKGIDYLSAVEGTLIKRQLDFLLKDIQPDAMKTGMQFTNATPASSAACAYSLTASSEPTGM